MPIEDWKDRGEEIMGALRHNMMLSTDEDNEDGKEDSDC